MDASQTKQNNERFNQWIAYVYSNGILYAEFERECKKRFITHVLRANNGNQCRAARELGMHRNTLSRTIAELKMDPYEWDPRRQLSRRVPERASRVQPAIGAA